MDLQDLRDMIVRTTPDEWHTIVHGPTFLNYFGVDGDDLGHTEHDERATYRHDVDVVLAWGLDIAGIVGERSQHHAEWLEKGREFQAPEAFTELADILYRGSVVDRVEYLVVDGSRAYLPIPDALHKATHWERDFVKILDQIAGHTQFDRYFKSAGMRV